MKVFLLLQLRERWRLDKTEWLSSSDKLWWSQSILEIPCRRFSYRVAFKERRCEFLEQNFIQFNLLINYNTTITIIQYNTIQLHKLEIFIPLNLNKKTTGN